MSHIVEIVKVIEDNEIEKLGNGLDEILFHENGRQIIDHLLIKHPKTNFYSPSLWASFKPAVLRYVRENNLTSRQLRTLADELHITVRTLKSAISGIEE